MNTLRSVFPNAWYIARREYLMLVRRRSFTISTIVIALAALAMGIAPVIIQGLSEGAKTRISVVAGTADVPANAVASITGTLGGAPAGGDAPGTGKEFVIGSAPDRATAEADLRAGTVNGVLVICRTADGSIPAPCQASGPPAATPAPSPGDLVFLYRGDATQGGRLAYMIGQAATTLAVQDRLERSGIAAQDQAKLFGAAAMAISNPKNDGRPSTPQGGQGATGTVEDEVSRIILGTVLIVLIFVTIITYGTWVAMSVAEEKNSRVMELMLNAATPIQMLAGKVLGNGAAGFTQYVVILAAGAVGLLAQNQVAEMVLGSGGSVGLPTSGVTISVLVAFGMFFVLGFTLYALLYAAAGSLVSRQEDVQQASMPLMMLAMVGYFAATFGVQSTDAPWVVVLSFVPFFSPYLMLARLVISPVAPWEIALAVVLLLVTIVAALWVAARIYRAGVLLYGQRVGIRQVLSAARVPR